MVQRKVVLAGSSPAGIRQVRIHDVASDNRFLALGGFQCVYLLYYTKNMDSSCQLFAHLPISVLDRLGLERIVMSKLLTEIPSEPQVVSPAFSLPPFRVSSCRYLYSGSMYKFEMTFSRFRGREVSTRHDEHSISPRQIRDIPQQC